MTEALLQEAPWVRRLALSLAANPTDAADLEQDIWHAWLARKGDAPRSARAWLTGTARKLAALRARTAIRARAREAAAAAPEVVADDGATLTARAELHRRLLDAVDALPDAMREAILLRYFEEMPPKEIAHRLRVSVHTVHTRLQRGRERLRADLDRSYDRRAAWTALALVDWRGRAVAAAGVATPIATVLIMSTSKPAVLVLAAVVLAIPTWLAVTSTTNEASEPIMPAGAQLTAEKATKAHAETAPREVRTAGARKTEAAPPPAGMGRVVDMQGQPIEGASVRFGKYQIAQRDGWPAARTRTTDAKGLFALPPEGMSYLHPVHPDYVADRRSDRVPDDAPVILRMRKQLAVPLTVTLADSATGAPVPRFTLTARTVWKETKDNGEPGMVRLFSAPDELDCRNGSFTGTARFVEGGDRCFVALDCPGLEPPADTADAAYYRALQEARSALRRLIEPVAGQPIRLDFAVDLGLPERNAASRVLRGAVVDAKNSQPIQGVSVAVRPAGATKPTRTVQTDIRGWFTIVKPANGELGLVTFEHPDYVSLAIAGSDLGEAPVALAPRASLTVTVLDAHGAPMTEHPCHVIRMDTTTRHRPEPFLTDGAGVIRRDKIEPGRYVVLVLSGIQGNDDHPLATLSFEVESGAAAEHTVRVGGTGGTVTGKVLQADGGLLQRCSVVFLSHAKAGPMLRSERQRTTEALSYVAKNVPPGAYMAFVMIDRGDEILAYFPKLDIGSDPITSLDLRIPAAPIRGRLIGWQGDPSTLRILALPALPEGSTAAGILANRDVRRRMELTPAADGSFAIPRAGDGDWVLEVLTRSGREPHVLARRTIKVATGAQLGDWQIAN